MVHSSMFAVSMRQDRQRIIPLRHLDLRGSFLRAQKYFKHKALSCPCAFLFSQSSVHLIS